RSALEVGAPDMFDGKLSCHEAAQKGRFDARARPCRQQVGHLRDHEIRNYKGLADLFEPRSAPAMVRIIAESRRDQRSGIDHNRAQTNPSASSLSSACLAE